MGTVYRYERSGALYGLLRVRGFTQDDAHIMCAPEQIFDEIRHTVGFAKKMWRAFGFTEVAAYLATRPAKAVGSNEDWEKATTSLQRALDAEGMQYEVDEGGGAFYGPKIDLKVKDAIGRLWQVTTIQFDFNLPERFDMTFIDTNGNQVRPFVVHRALLGSLERFFGILIEHYAGKFPAWLAPEQARIIPISDKEYDYAKKLLSMLHAQGLRATIDAESESLGNRIKKARNERIPYYLVIGAKEVETQSVAVRKRDSEEVANLSFDECVGMLSTECREPEF